MCFPLYLGINGYDDKEKKSKGRLKSVELLLVTSGQPVNTPVLVHYELYICEQGFIPAR